MIEIETECGFERIQSMTQSILFVIAARNSFWNIGKSDGAPVALAFDPDWILHVAPLFESELLSNGVQGSHWQVFLVHRNDRLLAIQEHLQVRTISLYEGGSKCSQFAFEFLARHGRNVTVYVYKVKPGSPRFALVAKGEAP
jgi:hypothetical protein